MTRTPAPPDALSARLRVLEAERAASDVLSRYFDLCDVPGPLSDTAQLAALFTPDAVWQGVGDAYERKFGRLDGRDAIVAMVAGHLPPDGSFVANAHVLGAGRVTADGDEAAGQWLMQQVSRTPDGRGELRCARITVDFELSQDADAALIRHFRTELLFVAALDAAAAASALGATQHEKEDR